MNAKYKKRNQKDLEGRPTKIFKVSHFNKFYEEIMGGMEHSKLVSNHYLKSTWNETTKKVILSVPNPTDIFVPPVE